MASSVRISGVTCPVIVGAVRLPATVLTMTSNRSSSQKRRTRSGSWLTSVRGRAQPDGASGAELHELQLGRARRPRVAHPAARELAEQGALERGGGIPVDDALCVGIANVLGHDRRGVHPSAPDDIEL